jgi:hypothetical protein
VRVRQNAQPDNGETRERRRHLARGPPAYFAGTVQSRALRAVLEGRHYPGRPNFLGTWRMRTQAPNVNNQEVNTPQPHPQTQNPQRTAGPTRRRRTKAAHQPATTRAIWVKAVASCWAGSCRCEQLEGFGLSVTNHPGLYKGAGTRYGMRYYSNRTTPAR